MGCIKVNLLKAKLVERELSVTNLAEMIGLDRATLYRKLQDGGYGITVGEANKIVSALNLSLTEAMEIFFAGNVA